MDFTERNLLRERAARSADKADHAVRNMQPNREFYIQLAVLDHLILIAAELHQLNQPEAV